jgi:hypothetical protein
MKQLTPTATILCDPSTGKVNGASVSLRPGTPARTCKFGHRGCALAKYDRAGRLLGVEVKDRVRLMELATAAQREGKAVRRFLQEAMPPRLLMF